MCIHGEKVKSNKYPPSLGTSSTSLVFFGGYQSLKGEYGYLVEVKEMEILHWVPHFHGEDELIPLIELINRLNKIFKRK